MNGDTLYALRDALDLREADFAALLGLTGSSAAQTLHDMEKGRKPISGPLKELIPRIASEHGLTLISDQWISK